VRHPYEGIAPYARWDRAVATVPPPEVDPVVHFPFKLTPDCRIVTAGSCFAQHIARYLKREGFNFLVTEPGHPLLEEAGLREAFNYAVFSARFGNIYTSRQLEQLFRRAYGTFVPEDLVWERPDGRMADPFRPNIQPGGFCTTEELEADRRQHLAAVRQAFEQLDVFVFTLGLTECWAAVADGAVFPLAPGVSGGTFDPDRYAFVNLRVDEVVEDMTRFILSLRQVNPAAKVILTVSPVPLIATAVDRHVLVSTTYSKAVLRVAAETLADSLEDVCYFPSYEIVTGSFSRGRYFADDLRSVTEAGVAHVMSLFFRHGTTGAAVLPPEAAAPGPEVPPCAPSLDKAIEVLCDEEFLLLDAGRKGASPPEGGNGKP
jgi:hypothetical protein